MTEDLPITIRHYLSASLQTLMNPSQEKTIHKGSVAILKNQPLELQMLANELESQPEFVKLVSQTASAFSATSKSWDTLWESHVKNFFRRSGYYANAFDGTNPDIDDTVHAYVQAFKRHTIQVTYLAPIEFVEFGQPSFDFDTFRIVRFSPTELHRLVGNDVNQVFYPYATVDIETLTHYWFIVVNEDVVPPEPGSGGFIDLSGRIQFQYSHFPKAIESAIQKLALYDWSPWSRYGPDEGDLTTGWTSFNVPFVLTVDDNLLEPPTMAPDVSILSTEPVPDGETGEFLSEERARLIDICDDDATEEFTAFVRRTETLFRGFKTNENAKLFLDTALGYFLKASLSEGMEQLLWYIAVIEALLGDKEGEGLTGRLKKRIALIFGNTNNEQKDIRKRFDALYDFRSNLVHGNSDLGQKEIYLGHLREAREFARKTLLWFLELIDHIIAQYTTEGRSVLPTREDIIHVLDIEEGSRDRIKRLIEALPEGFPKLLRTC